MTDVTGFTIVEVRRNPLKHNGTPRRNGTEVDVVVDGRLHTIRVRHNSGIMKGAEHEKRQDWPEIRKRVFQHMLTTIFEPAYHRYLARKAP